MQQASRPGLSLDRFVLTPPALRLCVSTPSVACVKTEENVMIGMHSHCSQFK